MPPSLSSLRLSTVLTRVLRPSTKSPRVEISVSRRSTGASGLIRTALPEGVDLHDELVGPEVTITAAAIERFCDVVGNQGEKFKASRNLNVEAPMDFAIVTGWQVCLGFRDYVLLHILM